MVIYSIFVKISPRGGARKGPPGAPATPGSQWSWPAAGAAFFKVLVRFRPFQGHIRDPRPILPRIDTLIVENERFPWF